MQILVVDDHALIREALRGVLRELDAQAAILEAADARGAARLIAEHPGLDLVLLDLGLPDGSGFDLLAELRAGFPGVAAVVLSASGERDDMVRALDLGALGFIPKSARREVMLGALRLILSGGIYVPPEILGPARAAPPPATAASAPSGRPPPAAALGLTARQMEVLALMMQGRSNKMICRALGIAEPTVKNHVTTILRALGAANRTEAVIAAGGLGLATRDTG